MECARSRDHDGASQPASRGMKLFIRGARSRYDSSASVICKPSKSRALPFRTAERGLALSGRSSRERRLIHGSTGARLSWLTGCGGGGWDRRTAIAERQQLRQARCPRLTPSQLIPSQVDRSSVWSEMRGRWQEASDVPVDYFAAVKVARSTDRTDPPVI